MQIPSGDVLLLDAVAGAKIQRYWGSQSRRFKPTTSLHWKAKSTDLVPLSFSLPLSLVPFWVQMSMPPYFLGKPENFRPWILQINHLFGGLEHLLFFHSVGNNTPSWHQPVMISSPFFQRNYAKLPQFLPLGTSSSLEELPPGSWGKNVGRKTTEKVWSKPNKYVN